MLTGGGAAEDRPPVANGAKVASPVARSPTPPPTPIKQRHQLSWRIQERSRDGLKIHSAFASEQIHCAFVIKIRTKYIKWQVLWKLCRLLERTTTTTVVRPPTTTTSPRRPRSPLPTTRPSTPESPFPRRQQQQQQASGDSVLHDVAIRREKHLKLKGHAGNALGKKF